MLPLRAISVPQAKGKPVSLPAAIIRDALKWRVKVSAGTGAMLVDKRDADTRLSRNRHPVPLRRRTSR
jgi:hypothetical protein